MLLTYGFLILAIISLWMNIFNKQKLISLTLFAISVVCAYIFNFIEVTGILSLIIFGTIVYFYYNNKKYKSISFIALFLISILYSLHKISGFNNYNVVKDMLISKDAIPYSLYFNFDKASIGFFVLLFSGKVIKDIASIKKDYKKVLLIGSITIAVTIFLSIFLGYIKFEPKFPVIAVQFIFANLFFTCISEEIVFRKLVQGKLEKIFGNLKFGNWIALIIGSIVFGLAHFAGGTKYILLAAAAGFGYGYIFKETKKIEYSIVVHYFLNIIHFFLFTYPALQTAFK